MSAATSTSLVAQAVDNLFELSDQDNNTNVTLRLDRSGPIIKDAAIQAPSLEYQGIEGTLSFSGPQVVTETTALGRMFTVILNIVPDLRTLSFTVFLPNVIHKANTHVQPFKTIAVKSELHTSLLGQPGPGGNPTYAVFKMHGTATKVEVAD